MLVAAVSSVLRPSLVLFQPQPGVPGLLWSPGMLAGVQTAAVRTGVAATRLQTAVDAVQTVGFAADLDFDQKHGLMQTRDD